MESFDALTGVLGIAALGVATFHAAATAFEGLAFSSGPGHLVGSGWLALGLQRMRGASSHVGLILVILGACLPLAFPGSGGRQSMLKKEGLTLVRAVSGFLIGCCAYGAFSALRDHISPGWLATVAVWTTLMLAAAPPHHILDVILIAAFAVTVLGLHMEMAKRRGCWAVRC
jgi:hypothetical protein